MMNQNKSEINEWKILIYQLKYLFWKEDSENIYVHIISFHFYIISDYEIWTIWTRKHPFLISGTSVAPYIIWFIQEFMGLFFHP